MAEAESRGHQGIPAYAHSADYLFDATFNAKPWFEQASEDELKKMIEVHFTGEASKQIVFFFDETVSLLQLVLDYWRTSGVDFVVEVHPGIAAAWIRRERPHLAHLLLKDLQ